MESNSRLFDPKKGKVKRVKVSLEQVMKAQRGRRGMAKTFL